MQRTASARSAPADAQIAGEALQAAPRLVADRAADELARLGIERHLAGAEQQAAGDDAVAVGADRGGRADGGDGAAMMGQRSSWSRVRSSQDWRIARRSMPYPMPAGQADERYRGKRSGTELASRPPRSAFAARRAVGRCLPTSSGRSFRHHAVRRGRLPLRRSSTSRWTAAARVPGSVRLSLKRLPAAARARRARRVVALAGGPGQAGAADRRLVRRGARAAARAAATSLVFDQRGTGDSGALVVLASRGWPRTTSAASAPARASSARRAAATARSTASRTSRRCASPAATSGSCIYGVSYGTKVALTYAARHPGPRRRRSCSTRSCRPTGRTRSRAPRSPPRAACCASSAPTARAARATPNVTGDLRRAVRRLERRPLRGFVTSPRGRRVASRSTRPALWNVLLAGDLNPALRAELPGALRAMLRRDRTPILRLLARADGLTGTAGDRRAARPSQSAGCSPTTSARRCSRRRAARRRAFPWDARRERAHAAAPGAWRPRGGCRRAPFAPFGALRRARGRPLRALRPLARRLGARRSRPARCPTCRRSSSTAATDLRTSAEQARAAVAAIPGARVAVIARSGHSVLGERPRGLRRARGRGFRDRRRARLHAGRERLPADARAAAEPRRGRRARRRRRRTVNAVLATLDDVRRQLIGDAIAAQRPVSTGSRTGGLRGGVATVRGLIRRRSSGVSYVPGVTVSGQLRLPRRHEQVRVARTAAPRAATLTIDAERQRDRDARRAPGGSRTASRRGRTRAGAGPSRAASSPAAAYGDCD